MADVGKLVHAAVVLREGSGQNWEQFILALREYSATVNQEMVRSPPELLARSQGIAMGVQELLMTLMQAPQTFDKMRVHANTKRARNEQW